MTQLNKQVDKNVKAQKILELTTELHDLQAKRKSVAAAFTIRIKEIRQDILDVLNDEQTAKEIVENVHTEHDLKVIS
jgi:hypothetical protein